MPTRILVDANVLMSRILRDAVLILQIEAPGMFSTCWTEDILTETLYHVRRNNQQLSGDQMVRIRELITGSMTEQISSYEIVDLDGLRDPDDRHVHSAAVAGAVAMVVTQDRDFLDLDDEVADGLPYDILSIDDFLVLADDSGPAHVRRMVARQWEYWRKRDPAADLPARFRLANCPRFAARVAAHVLNL
ncbi:PIN domain-containing protein [Demequina lignilytica]|uniref:PIN domain-containing protein n=1 Tax=Demequina lignilytica TaxID=3051663 RepID=A0AB35MHB8_9MICO|nr:PIN domain-containing protein [Demequina sp. SYSU T0a273]MDN4483209.1 PIN domain-containing protein [Demequina sp. SYSU T0a273]